MEIQIGKGVTSIQLNQPEAERLGIAIAAGYEAISRAEYFIRTGLSQPTVQDIADVLTSIDSESEKRTISIELDAGIESVENPRRPPR